VNSNSVTAYNRNVRWNGRPVRLLDGVA
jgi:hypothetical protein